MASRPLLQRRALDQLPTWKEDGVLDVVVETTLGSAVKLKYDPELDAMTLSRPLPLGVTFTFEFGFVPSTCAEDGDPLHAAVALEGKELELLGWGDARAARDAIAKATSYGPPPKRATKKRAARSG